MSYILDALQRADAERARGGVPTLHARPIASPPLKNPLGAQQRAGLAIALVVALGAGATVWWIWRPAPQPAVLVPIAAPLPQTLTAPPHATAVAAVAPPPPKSKTPVSAAEPAPPPSKTKPATVPPVAAAPAPASAPTLAPLLSELPEATRHQIPAMAISGAVYSDNPAQRLLLVNGQVLNQGSQVAPDLTVVEIHSNNSEFNFRGTRFRLAH